MRCSAAAVLLSLPLLTLSRPATSSNGSPFLLNFGPSDVSLLPFGAACSANSQCASSMCASANAIHGDTICRPSPAGHQCSIGATCISQSCTNGICDRAEPVESSLCYTGADCMTDNCQSPILGEAVHPRCFPAGRGYACNSLHPDYCISGNCTLAGTCGTSQFGLCYDHADCGYGSCIPQSPTNPQGRCSHEF